MADEPMNALPPSRGGKNQAANAAGSDNQSLYADRVRIYPQKVEGAFRRFKWTALIVLLAIYYLAPWLRWDRGPGAPDQALLIDMPARRAYFFFIEIWPQEIYYLTGLLVLGAVGLFLVTSLFGRVWCAYSCPQTVWTDLFMWVERMVEGDRNARMRLDKGRWTAERIIKKITKHAIWFAIALLTGGAWVMYFTDAPTLVVNLLNFQVSGAVTFFILMFTATTYLLAGIAREQLCIYMCPWPRFQAAMFDEDTLTVTYEDWRGEPRGKHKTGDSWENRGHCVDCLQCVNVCPTGIDIRDGSQLECIGCGLCIDACNRIMTRLDLPRGLIRLDTVSNQVARAEGKSAPFRLLRPRTIVYTGLLALVAAVMLFGLTTRSTLEVSLLRDRNPLFVTLSDGTIRNGYTFKIINRARANREFILTLDGIEGATLAVLGGSSGSRAAVFSTKPDQVETFRVFVTAPRQALAGESTDLSFVLKEDAMENGEDVVQGTVFLGPKQ
ncbi:MAG: cytochrome c oxidase accessory protein CcoG [Alphaproteobacteria bacterium]|nr:cytochrome c oxidase accessory protein CcoG [Alphaproteobacteria bacterium]